jgi:hypothetical protein
MAHLLFPAEHQIKAERHKPEDVSEKEICEPVQTVMQNRKILGKQCHVHAPFAELKVPDHGYVHQHSDIYKKQNIRCLSFHRIIVHVNRIRIYVCMHGFRNHINIPARITVALFVSEYVELFFLKLRKTGCI